MTDSEFRLKDDGYVPMSCPSAWCMVVEKALGRARRRRNGVHGRKGSRRTERLEGCVVTK